MIRKFLLWLQPYLVRLYTYYGLSFTSGSQDSFGTLSNVLTPNPSTGGGYYAPKVPESTPQGSQVDQVVTTNAPGAHASHERPHSRSMLNHVPGAHVFALAVLTMFLAIPVFAQGGSGSSTGNAVINTFASGPTGSCNASFIAVNGSNGNFYDCWNGSYNLVTGGGGGGSPGGISGQIQYNNAGAFGGFTLAGDCTFSVPNITCTKTSGVAFAASATMDTTNASNISSGTLNVLRLPTAIPIGNVGTLGLSGTSPVAISAAGAISCATCNTSNASVSSIATTAPITGGTITTTGTIACGTCVVATTPGAGIAHFAGSTQTVTSSSVVGSDMANNTVTATQLAAQYSKGQCTEVWGGSGTSFALTSGDDAIANNSCYNDSGVTRTITAVKARSDNASNTTTVNPSFGSAGTGTTICSAALTAGSSYAYSSSCTVSNASWTTGTGIDPVMGGTLTGTSIALLIEYTY